MAAARSLEDVVDVLRRSAKRILGADGIAVVLRDGEFCHYVAEDSLQPLWKGQRFPLTVCVSGWAMLHGETVAVPDVTSDPRVPIPPYQNKAIRSLLMVPIGSPEPVAALGAYWCAMVFVGEGVISRAQSLAAQAGAAIARINEASLATVDADVPSLAEAPSQPAASAGLSVG
ncbi:GAF domain-containing protein [Methylobacterium gnaphalii]|nr:GAF domain-containing protein [Methylobacterium gnaphalii]GJD71539.1 hypothetical protein MMMDOFMJ_4501 [Methylobacterium gnaphalii]